MQKEKEKFGDWLRSKGLKDSSVKAYLFYYEKFGGVENLNQNYVNSFLKNNNFLMVPTAFIKNYVSFVKRNKEKFDGEILEKVNSVFIEKKTGSKERKIPKFITEQQLRKIEPFMRSERNKIMLLLSFYCGLRQKELIKIHPIDFEMDEVPAKLKVLGKGDKERFVIVPPSLMQRVENWCQEEAAAKPTKTETELLFEIGKSAWWSILTRSSEKAIGKKINPHALRHSFVTHFLNKGLPIEEVKELAGHESIATTQIYTHISRKKLEENFLKVVE